MVLDLTGGGGGMVGVHVHRFALGIWGFPDGGRAWRGGAGPRCDTDGVIRLKCVQ